MCGLTNRRSNQSNGSCLCSCQIQWEIVSVALMHHLHPKTCTVQDVCPGVITCPWRSVMDWLKLNPLRLNAMVHAEGGKPDAHDGPRCQEEVKAAAIIERHIEKSNDRVAMSCNDIVRFLFLLNL